MAELKTLPTTQDPKDFLNTIEPSQKRADGLTLLDIFETATGQKPKMWGTSIVGFGMYHYKSERSSQEGDWPLAGFSPRKQNLTLYLLRDFAGCEGLLKKLGKYKTSVACLYINKLSDIDQTALIILIKKSFNQAKKKLNPLS